MRCVQILAPGEVSVIERPVPTPGQGEVLLRIRRIGYCGTDLSTFRGGNPLVTYPRVPGHEIAATIEALGPGVPPHLRVGEAFTVHPYQPCGHCSACRQGRPNCCRNNQTLGVQTEGALAEFFVTHHSKLVRAPGLGLAGLALVEPLSVGFHAVARGRIQASDTVLVFGCGMIGLGAIAGAGLRIGATVIAVDLDDSKRSVAEAAGASHFINSAKEDLAARIADLTGGEGVDAAIEAVGTPATYQAAVSQACFGGRVVYIGYTKAPVSYESRLFVQKELDILGSRNATPEDFAAVIELLGSGRYPMERTITRTVALADAPQALRDWSANPGAITKIHIEL